MAALGDRDTLVPTRRAEFVRISGELCDWLHQKNIRYIEPHANFVMIDTGRDVRSFGQEMLRRGVAVGRPFPPLNQMLRVMAAEWASSGVTVNAVGPGYIETNLTAAYLEAHIIERPKFFDFVTLNDRPSAG